MAGTSVFRSRVFGGPFQLLRAVSRSSLIALIVALAALVSGVLTYLRLTGLAPYDPTPATMVVLIVVDLSLVLALAALIVSGLTRLWTERRSGAAGSKLHLRLVAMFSAIAVLPAILVAIFAAVSLNLGIEAWFSERVQTALANSVSVADAYVEEHKKVISSDILAMAADLNRAGPLLQADQKRIVDILETEAKLRALPAVYVVDSTGMTLASAKLNSMPDRGPVMPEQIEQAKSGQVVVLADSNDKAVSALVKLDAFVDAYLLVTRAVDPQVLAHQRGTQDAVSEYQRLYQNLSEIQLTFAALYVVVAMLILLAAVWLALWAANRIVTPIGRLAGAAERVSEGDLRVRVAVGGDDDEISALSETFNRMTSQLEAQRKELINANTQLDARRRFTEAMLAGVCGRRYRPGWGRGHHPHQSHRLAADQCCARGDRGPALFRMRARAGGADPARHGGIRRPRRPVRSMSDATARCAICNVQVSSEAGDKTHGFVITFDDITDLVSAQRTAAWADVARRIAHEIKNPLTPIQLSAERLKRKYRQRNLSDPEVFAQCTDTIIRQVGDIGRMVDEFSSFARMPAPVMRSEECAGAGAAGRVPAARGPTRRSLSRSPRPGRNPFECDGRLVSQALTNVLKNAVEAITVRLGAPDAKPGRIAIDLSVKAGRLIMTIRDNGIGLPAENRHRLTEPYVTTRAKGTGLGLAIVRKIFEDHGGELLLEDAAKELSGETGAVYA